MSLEPVSTPAIESVDQTAASSLPADAAEARAAAQNVRSNWRAVRWFAGLALAIAAGHVAYERIGTTANVDTVTVFPRYAQGTVAVGMTESDPGFLLLSWLDEDKLHIIAYQRVNWLSGARTVVEIRTPAGTWRKRLRGPRVIMVARDGTVSSELADWTHDDLAAISQAMDCAVSDGKHPAHCGQPLLDLSERLADGATFSLPPKARAFVREMLADGD